MVRVSLQVNNVTNENRIYASGYSYRYFSGDVRTGTAYYFPQATRNALLMLEITK